MKIRFLFIILISLSSCTLFIDRKNVSNSIPGEWKLILIDDSDTINGIAKFTYKKIDKDNFIQKFELRDNYNKIISKGDYVFTGMGDSSFLMLKDSISNFSFNGEMADFIYRDEKQENNSPIKYIEFIDTVKTTNSIIKLQLFDH